MISLSFRLLFVTAIALGFNLAFLSIQSVMADGKPLAEQPPANISTRQYNNRLPPVLPGEEVVSETGQKMRVWSSSGPVPVNQPPTPQALPSGTGGSGVGVIIDGRERGGVAERIEGKLP